MTNRIAIVDYGAGNLLSVSNALRFIGIDCEITREKSVIERASAVIVPGVGAFPDAMGSLNRHELRTVLCEAAAKKPVLGICLGMQILFDSGDEGGGTRGLGLIEGGVSRINTGYKLPHMGWNSLRLQNTNSLTLGLSGGERVFFVHSYMAMPTDPARITATADYGMAVTAMVAKGQLFGCQFHPEKSGEVGLLILENFARLI